MRTSEIEDSTRKTYVGYIERTIKPAVGGLPVSGSILVCWRASTPSCAVAECVVTASHAPLLQRGAASTVRQIHSILSGTLDAAARWEWIDASPAQLARRPKQKPSQPDPPSPADAARLAEESFRMDDDWGTLVWLVMTTGMRRGELCGLRFNRVDLDAELIDLRRNWVGGKEKDTKTHQNRRIALDSETVTLLREHERVTNRVRSIGGEFTEDLFVFSGIRSLDHNQPYSPNAVTQRYKDMADRIRSSPR